MRNLRLIFTGAIARQLRGRNMMNKLATTVRFITIAFVIAFVVGTWMLLFGLFVQAVKPGTLTQDFETVLAMRQE